MVINYLIIRAAFNERFLNGFLELFLLFIAGIITFTLFEIIGPQVIAFTLLLTPLYYILINSMGSRIDND